VTVCRVWRAAISRNIEVARGVLTAAKQETIMHKAIFAAVAAAALSAPALAEQANMNGPALMGDESQAPAILDSPQTRTVHSIPPETLSTQQVREIQRALGTRGVGPLGADGEWGPDIEAALRTFQRAENMISQSGDLDSVTLMALGLNPLTFGFPGAGETTGQAVREGTPPQETIRDVPERAGSDRSTNDGEPEHRDH
jgi:hypothetical protein